MESIYYACKCFFIYVTNPANIDSILKLSEITYESISKSFGTESITK